MDGSPEDAAGVAVGDGAAPAAPGLRALPCHGVSVDVFDSRRPELVLHVAADEFAAWAARVKAGAYDHLIPDELQPGN